MYIDGVSRYMTHIFFMYRCNSLIDFGGKMADMLSFSVVSSGEKVLCGQAVKTKHSGKTKCDVSTHKPTVLQYMI